MFMTIIASRLGFQTNKVSISLVFISLISVCACASKPEADVCSDVAKKAQRVLWDSMRAAGDELYCRKPWVKHAADELVACSAQQITYKFSNKLKNKWNALFDNANAE